MVELGNLVCCRHVGEAVCIGDDVTVTVLQIQRGKVRLRITAPRTVAVDRAEIRQRKLDDSADLKW